jgi:hypothetical protein
VGQHCAHDSRDSVIQQKLNGHTYAFSNVRRQCSQAAPASQRGRPAHTQRLERNATDTGSYLIVVALEIDLVRTELRDHVIKALIAVLQSGVRVQYRRLLPLRNQLPSFATWATLVRLLLGVDTDDHGRFVSVQRVVVPAHYVGVFHFRALLYYAGGCSRRRRGQVRRRKAPGRPLPLVRRARHSATTRGDGSRWRCTIPRRSPASRASFATTAAARVRLSGG